MDDEFYPIRWSGVDHVIFRFLMGKRVSNSDITYSKITIFERFGNWRHVFLGHLKRSNIFKWVVLIFYLKKVCRAYYVYIIDYYQKGHQYAYYTGTNHREKNRFFSQNEDFLSKQKINFPILTKKYSFWEKYRFFLKVLGNIQNFHRNFPMIFPSVWMELSL